MMKMRVEASITEIINDYFETRMPDIEGMARSKCITGLVVPTKLHYIAVVDDSGGTLEQFSDGLYQFTRYTRFRQLSVLVWSDSILESRIVSSIEFDKDGDYLAVGGVNNKIKVCMCGHVYMCICVHICMM